MKKNTWMNKGYIGHQLLTSNFKEVKYQLLFLGAETIGPQASNQFKIHFMITHQLGKAPHTNLGTNINSGVSYHMMVSEGEALRFEQYWGIYREITVEYAPNDFGLSNRFLRARAVRFIRIEKDFIEYEVCC